MHERSAILTIPGRIVDESGMRRSFLDALSIGDTHYVNDDNVDLLIIFEESLRLHVEPHE